MTNNNPTTNSNEAMIEAASDSAKTVMAGLAEIGAIWTQHGISHAREATKHTARTLEVAADVVAACRERFLSANKLESD